MPYDKRLRLKNIWKLSLDRNICIKMYEKHIEITYVGCICAYQGVHWNLFDLTPYKESAQSTIIK